MSSPAQQLVGEIRKEKQKRENKECIRRAIDFLPVPPPPLWWQKMERRKNGKKEGREWTDRVLRKVEVLENLEFI